MLIMLTPSSPRHVQPFCCWFNPTPAPNPLLRHLALYLAWWHLWCLAWYQAGLLFVKATAALLNTLAQTRDQQTFSAEATPAHLISQA